MIKKRGPEEEPQAPFFYGRKGSDKREIDREEVNEHIVGYGNREVIKKRLPLWVVFVYDKENTSKR